MQEYANNNPGAAIAVLRDGEVIARECSGLADLEARTPVTSSTNFRLASVTKPFIAAAVTILVERGVLRYDDPIARWLAIDSITIRQLLTHTSGLVDYEDLIPPEQTEQVSDTDVLRMLEATPRTLFTPGSEYRYSNSGYVLLGLLVERASGRSLEDFLRDEIFAKHGMHGTTLGPPSTNRAYGYDRDGANWARRDQSVTSATRGDGGIYSSIDDLARWVALLRAELGWFVADGMIYHTGDTVSFRNAIVRWPAEKMSVIVLTNRNEGDPLGMGKHIIVSHGTPGVTSPRHAPRS